MTSINLAPDHKSGLTLDNPVMPAAGCFGFGTEYSRLVEVEGLGAIVVGPVTAGPRQGTAPPRTVPVPGGVLLHTGLANPGLGKIVRRYAHAWARSPVPIIVHVAGVSPEEAASCCSRLFGLEAVAGIELGLPDAIASDEAAAIIRAARAVAYQPLIARLPLDSAGSLCEAAVEAGTDALTVAAPPRGTAWHAPCEQFISGRLYGPLVLPLALRALRQVAERVSVPLVGCGGVHSAKDARAFLHAGAVAVQVDGAIWRDPGCMAHIAHDLAA
jgi:dihydroorotate dehydrogenase (NAD+) catalytic subunit